MEKIYAKFGDINTLKEVISSLHNFTGVIRINDSYLFYKNSKLIFAKYKNRKESLENIISNLPEKFFIEIYRLNIDELDSFIKKDTKDIFIELSKVPILKDGRIIINKYNDIYNYINTNKVIFEPKRFKKEKAVVLYKNKKEMFSIYIGRKILFGKRAISKLKTTFAVSEFEVRIKPLTDEDIEKYKEEYPEGFLFLEDDYKKVIDSIIQDKNPTILKNISLSETFQDLGIIKIVGSEVGYVVTKNKKPVYAFLNEYNGEKSFRYIKSMCLVDDIKYYIYKISKDEYDKLTIFKENKI